MEAVKLKTTELADRFNEYAAFVLKDGYLYDKENSEAINACIEVIKKNECGLMILGNPGSGKTLFFEIIQRVTNPKSEQIFTRISVLEVVLQFNNKEVGHGVFRKWSDKHVFFDDLGTEDRGYLFGEKVEVFEKFIQYRYDLFRNRKIKTHFTTNLSYLDLKARYGARCVSRLNEMCEVVILGGDDSYSDRRELRNFVGLPPVFYPVVLSQEEIEWRRKYALLKENAKNAPPAEHKGIGQRLRGILGT